MSKYHIKDNGSPGVCRARTIESCPKTKSGDSFHGSFQEALIESERRLNKLHGNFSTSRNVAPDIESADDSFLYAKWSLLNGHLHNATGVGNKAEIFYYSSRAGRLELERRLINNPFNKDLLKVQETIDEPDFVRPDITDGVDEQFFQEMVKLGREKFFSQEITSPSDRDEIGAFLLEQSHEWLKKLSTEEQEVVSFSTSNGFIAISEATRDDDKVSYEAKTALKPFVQQELDELYQNTELSPEQQEAEETRIFKDKARDFYKTFTKAIRKAPVMDKPFYVYRGSTSDALETIYRKRSVSKEESRADLVSQELNGDHFGPSSTFGKTPRSSSVFFKSARSFARRGYEDDYDYSVVFKIQQKTLASPAAVSAWGYKEGEVFTNHQALYTVTGSELDKDNDSRFIVSIEERV